MNQNKYKFRLKVFFFHVVLSLNLLSCGNEPTLPPKDGINIEKYQNNQLSEKFYAKNGMRNGPDTSWYQNGIISETSYWKNDKKLGYKRSFDENGNKNYIQIYDTIRHDPIIHFSYYPNGSQKAYRDRNINQKWYINGNLKHCIVCKDWELEGEGNYYHSNGNRRLSGNYVKGHMYGNWIYFDSLDSEVCTSFLDVSKHNSGGFRGCWRDYEEEK